jgi:hypothetical protein
MQALEALVRDGSVTLLALSVLALELAVFLAMSRSRGFLRVAGPICNVLSGLFLIIALRAALLDQGAMAIAACLGLSFLAHAADTILRWRP